MTGGAEWASRLKRTEPGFGLAAAHARTRCALTQWRNSRLSFIDIGKCQGKLPFSLQLPSMVDASSPDSLSVLKSASLEHSPSLLPEYMYSRGYS